MYVESLAEFKLGLFGKGWEKFPQFAEIARPEVSNGPQLRDLIQRSAINLHLHTWTVHHPRLYDTAAAGGFLLVGRVSEKHRLGEVFDVGAEVEDFGSIGELKRKIRHFLAHPSERLAMADRAARRAVRDHTMERRMGDVVGFLGEDVYDQQ
jgi:spore maturation protein CgeB